MTTIVEPQKHIVDLWSVPKVKSGETFRLMRYVMRVDHKGKVLLHNVVTGHLVILDQDEASLLTVLPAHYSPKMEELIAGHFFVPKEFDEHQLTINLRTILRKLADTQISKDISKYTILPTTACNARCYYCFEHGIKSISMSEKTANQVVEFIKRHCGGSRNIFLTWFGGEPTVGAVRIDQICEQLKDAGVQFESAIITNGYLFDEEMIQRAKSLWNLKHAQISVDGAETNTNQIKSFVDAVDNPYQRILNNIWLLVKAGVHVSVRMNFDLGNYQDFRLLLDDLQKKKLNNKFLKVYPTPVLGEHADKDGIVRHANDEWMIRQICELRDLARAAGFDSSGYPLPRLVYTGCSAADDAYIIIGPDGSLLKCLECVEPKHALGNLEEGITNQPLRQAWKETADYKKCIECTFFPSCAKTRMCSAGERCYQLDNIRQYEYTIRKKYEEEVNDVL